MLTYPASTLFGIRLVSHALAVKITTSFHVVLHGSPFKKRKRWRVQRVSTTEPSCYKAGDTLYMHPSLYAKLQSIRDFP